MSPRVFLLLSLVALFGCDREGNEQPRAGSEETGPLPVLSQVPAFSLTDETGKAFGSNELKGTPYLVAFFFTRCPSICPRLMASMREVHAAAAKSGTSLKFVSISVDPTNDTPEVLSAYAKKHGAAHANWKLLTGDYKYIAETSEQGFKIGLSGQIDEKKEHLGITHGSHFVLVDGKGQIRGYFRSSEKTAPADIIDALGRL